MNLYKDLYKKANNNIPTDDAKMRVMARIEKPVAVRVKPRRKVAEFAALAACLVFTFAALGIYNNFEKEQNDKILRMNIPETARVLEEAPVSVEPTAEPQDVSQTPLKAEVKSTPKPKTTKAPEAQAKEPAVVEVLEPVAVLENQVEEPLPEAHIIVNEAKEISGSEPEPASLMMDRSIGKIEEVTLQEYYEYLGKNIESDVDLPEGFSLITEDEAMFEVADSGEYKNDSWCFVYEKEEMSVEIITSKKTEDVLAQLADESYEKSKISGGNTVVIKENDIYKAYMVAEDVGYTVTSFGLDEAELENLLVSLAK